MQKLSPANALMQKRLSEASKGFSQKIVHIFQDVHLGNAHHGLAEIAGKEGIEIAKLKMGEYVFFINSKRTALKMFSTGNVIAHLRMPNDQRLDMGVIVQLPRFFNGRSINYNEALKERILKILAKNGKKGIAINVEKA